jgi:hypothetical protein
MANSTKIFDGVTLDGTSTAGEQETVEQAITESAVLLHIEITPTAPLSRDVTRLTIKIATSPNNLGTPADAITQMGDNAKSFEIKVLPNASSIWEWSSEAIIVSGEYAYVWFDVPNKMGEVTVDGWIVEL